MKRRDFVVQGASLGGALALAPDWAAAQSAPLADDRLAPRPGAFGQAVGEFLRGAVPVREGLVLEAPSIADNAASVPVKARVTLPLTDARYCEEVLLLAELNPLPVLCRFHFTQATGSAEAAVRVRLSQAQTLHALARMSDGTVLAASQDVSVGAGGCGM